MLTDFQELEVEACCDKCEHGVRIAKGDTFARYCTGCNPGSARIMVPHRRVVDVDPPEHDVDAAEYLEAPVWERLEAAERMETMTL